jgi:small ligand-binding sensory domain FIST
MKLFAHGHAAHPDWRVAADLALAQLRAHMALPHYEAAPDLGLLYFTDHYAAHAGALLGYLRDQLPQVAQWTGTVGVGVAANGVEYFDEPALVLMLAAWPQQTGQARVFSGRHGWPHDMAVASALVHADGHTPDLAELMADMAGRTEQRYLFGGLSASRAASWQLAWSSASDAARAPDSASTFDGLLSGGLSGVAFGPDVGLLSRVTQGCQPVGPEHTVSHAQGNVVLALDGRPALDVLFEDLGLPALASAREAAVGGAASPLGQALHKVRATLVGMRSAPQAQGSDSVRERRSLGADVVVRHITGLDPGRRGVAVADLVQAGQRLTFCQRHVQAARADLMRMCAEIREELEPVEQSLELATALAGADTGPEPHPGRRVAGAIYVSCAGRGGPHFGGPSAELAIVRHALGDVPLVGFFAGGEIAYHRLYGYTGVLTVFTTPVA